MLHCGICIRLKMKVKNVQREREKDKRILNLFITEIHEEKRYSK